MRVDEQNPARASPTSLLFTEPLTPRTNPDNAPKWDSPRHIALVPAIEETDNTSPSMDEMTEMVTGGHIQKVPERYCA